MPRVVLMGVAGAGKSTVGVAVAHRLGWSFVDADDLHSPADRARMASGEALDDARRAVWIERVRVALKQDDVVVACSALRREHRRRLESGGGVHVYLLEVPAEELARRLGARTEHVTTVPHIRGSLSLARDTAAHPSVMSPGHGQR